MIESVAGIMNAAPMPCAARPATSQASLCESPMKALERPKTMTPKRNIAPAAEDVAQAPAGDEQDGEAQRVGVDGPFQAADRGVQVLLDRRAARRSRPCCRA